ncbi:hypothetical protein ACTJJJ_00060 [Dyadobacter sp. 22481]
MKKSTDSGMWLIRGGRVVVNNIKHTIQNMTDTECFEIALSLQALQQKVADEFR